MPDPELDGMVYDSIADVPTGEQPVQPTSPPSDAQVSELMGRVEIGELLPSRVGGRPPIEMTPQLRRQLVALAQIHCTMEEISAVTEISHDVLLNRPEFRELVLAGRARGRASLRRLQFQKAADGNVPMLVWLGKNLLGQTDRAVLGQGDDAAYDGNSNINRGAGDAPTSDAQATAEQIEATAEQVANELRARLDAIRRNRLESAERAERAARTHDGAHGVPELADPVIDAARTLPPPPPRTAQAEQQRRGFTFQPHTRRNSPEYGGQS